MHEIVGEQAADHAAMVTAASDERDDIAPRVPLGRQHGEQHLAADRFARQLAVPRPPEARPSLFVPCLRPDAGQRAGAKRGASMDPQGYDAGKKVTGRKRHQRDRVTNCRVSWQRSRQRLARDGFRIEGIGSAGEAVAGAEVTAGDAVRIFAGESLTRR
jgi:hypothetical protein